MKISKEFKVGLLTVISGSILYFGFNYLKGINAFSSNHHYFAVYEQVDGLQVSNPVMINGLTVGRVNDIKILPGGSSKILVEIEVEEEITVGGRSEAHLVDNGLLGGKMISLILKNGGSLNEGDTLVSKKPLGMMDNLQANASPLMDKVGAMLDSAKALTGDLPMDDIKGLMKELKSTVVVYKQTALHLNSMLATNKSKIDTIMTKFESASDALEKIDPLLEKVNTITDSLSQVEFAALTSELKHTLTEAKNVMKSINDGEGSVGKLMKDEAVYDNLNTTIKHLDSLFIDMKEHPGRYVQFSVFGKKDKEAKKAEKEAKKKAKQNKN